MTISEKISLINDLYISARTEEQREGITINSAYLTINDCNKVGVWSLAANTVFSGTDLTLCCIDKNYLSYGWQTYRTVYAIFDKENNIVNNIKLGKWSFNWGFVETRQERSPISQIRLFLDSSQDEKVILISYTLGYQEIWNCLLEINQNCNTLKEAEFYFKYFESNFKNNTLEKSFQLYKEEIEAKDNIINQYQTLLDSIKKLVGKEA